MLRICYSIKDIQRLADGVKVIGDIQTDITGISTLTEAGPGDLSFLGNRKYKADVENTKASVILVPEDYVGEPANDQAYIVVENPSISLALVCREIECSLWPKREPSVHETVSIAPDVKVGKNVFIGPCCVIDEGSVIGDDTIIEAHSFIGKNVIVGDHCWLMPKACILDYCELGNRIKLSSGVVIGSDGFGYETVDAKHNKVPQIGRVIVGDDVDIGANTTIDRARFGSTVIGNGTKIDNLVQIGHNVSIGENCIIVSQVGISGSTIIEDSVVIAGQAGLAGHLRIGKGSQLSAQCGVNHDLEEGSFVRGTPAFPFMMANRVEILKRRLPDLFKRVEKVEKFLQQMQESAPNTE